MRKLKLFLSMLMLIAFSVGNVWAETAEFSYSDLSGQGASGSGADFTGATKGDVFMSGKGNGNTSYVQIYANGTLTFTPLNGATITKIVLEATTSGYVKTWSSSPEGASVSDKYVTWEGSSTSVVTLTNTASGQARIKNMTVTYTEGGGTPTCATPTFSPAAGSYEGTQNVTISSTAGATIYYTTDGSDPSTSSSVYSSPIAVSASQTIKAYAVKAEYDDSEVATAAYEITEGPDVTIAFEGNTNWNIPSGSGNKTVNEGTYTDDTYTIKIAGSTGEGYYINGYLLLGKTGAYVELPEFSNPVEKIVVVGTSGGSTGVKFNIYDDTKAVSTEVTGCKNVSQEFTIETPEANKAYKVQVTSNANLQISAIKIFFGEAPAVAKPTISGNVYFATSTSVTISHADADHIYYTTNGDNPTTSSTEYSAPFSLTNTATVKAIAVKGSDVSEVAVKAFTKVTPKTTAAELRAFATPSNQNAFIQLDGWKVTFVKGNNAYLVDPSNEGVILNNAGHGYTAGEELNDEVVEATIKLSSGRVQLTGFTSSNITATAGSVSPAEIADYSTLTSAHQSRLVTLKDATYASSAGTFSDGANVINFYDQFSASPTLVDGATYDVTGIVIYYDNGSTSKLQIAPRTAADVVATSAVTIPTSANLAELKAKARGANIVTLTNAVITYVNGNNAFVEEGTTGALIYFANHGYSAGDCLNGDYQVTTEDHNGKFEITAIEPQTGAETTTATIPLTTVTIEQLNTSFASYESRRVKILGVNVSDVISGDDRDGAITKGANTLAVYASVKNTITLTLNDNVDIIGYPGFYNANQQLTVWQQADITVNEKEEPELAYNPTVVNVLLSDLASFTPAVLEYATGFDGVAAITYESSDPSIATVETDGTVTLVATDEGSTTITATFAGNDTYKAGNASYTITVSVTPITPVYTMSFDLTRASYDAASSSQVVWNSNVVTIQADKAGSSTSAINYIGGAYDSSDKYRSESRFYKNSTLTFTPQTGVQINKVEYTATSASYATALSSSTWSNATATADNKLVTITPTDKSAAFSATISATTGCSLITVYYEAESEKAKLTASIVIANINTAVGEDDIVLLDIAATSNPNKNAISYSITSGSEYVSLVGEGSATAFHALAEGTATITATIPNNLGNYTGATTTFGIVVAAAPATLVSVAVSGTPDKTSYYAGQNFDPAGLTVTGTYSDASTAPITEGITWSYNPSQTLAKDQTSIGVTATVNEIPSAEFEVTGLTVTEAPAPTSGNVAIVVLYDGKYYAMSTTVKNSNGFEPIEVQKEGAKVVVASNEEKEAIQWLKTTSTTSATFQNGDDKYLACSADANTGLALLDDASSWEWDATNSCYKQPGKDSKGRTFYYNYNTGNHIFRAYTVSGIGADNYSGAPEFIDAANIEVHPDYGSYQRDVTKGNYGTICLPKAGTITGATLFEIAYYDETAKNIYLDEVGSTMAAGKPYIFQATASQLNVRYTSGDVVATAGNYHGLYGFYDLNNENATTGNLTQNAGNYILYSNAYWLVSGRDAYVANYRAYIKLGVVGGAPTSAQAPALGRRRVAMAVHGEQVATGVGNVQGNNVQCTKVLINGQLFILRGEKMFDATGRLVK